MSNKVKIEGKNRKEKVSQEIKIEVWGKVHNTTPPLSSKDPRLGDNTLR